MSLLLQISDTHFGTEQAPVVEALLQLAQRERPSLCVLSGDITQRARRAQFDAARAFVDRLAMPLQVVIPGNHDIPLFDVATRVFAPYRHFRRVFGSALEAEVSTADFLLIALNTTRPWRHKHGEISIEQVRRVAERLRRADPAQLRIVVTHQPVAVPNAAETNNLLRGRMAALREWSDAGADLVLGGHIHLPYVLELRQRFADLRRRLWCVQAGTAVSSRIRAGVPNSVNLVRFDRAAWPLQCGVERHDFNAVTGEFECVERHELDPDRGARTTQG